MTLWISGKPSGGKATAGFLALAVAYFARYFMAFSVTH
jgi:hypothetical protein